MDPGNSSSFQCVARVLAFGGRRGCSAGAVLQKSVRPSTLRSLCRTLAWNVCGAQRAPDSISSINLRLGPADRIEKERIGGRSE
jgi:hypothetical protein